VGVHTRLMKVTCWYCWGRKAASRKRTAFYSLALPGRLSSKLPSLEIQES
jgi:hypothetical protein